ncbi:hypothetical protein AB0B94_22605 [Micromonospora sp. NPDC048986]
MRDHVGGRAGPGRAGWGRVGRARTEGRPALASEAGGVARAGLGRV